MRALWVSAETPDRDGGGGNIRQAHLLLALARSVPTDLLLAGHVRDEAVRGTVETVTEVPFTSPAVPAGLWRRRARDLRHAAAASGTSETRYYAPARAALSPLLAERDYDVVVVDSAGLAPLLPAQHQARWCLTLQNVHSETLRQARASTSGRRQRWTLSRDEVRARALERWCVDSYDEVFTVSSEDAAAVPGPTTVVPNGVDGERFSPSPLPSSPTLLLTASLDYAPNVDGARWFCDEVLPLVRQRVPDLQLTIAGRSPVDQVRALAARPGVQVLADVPAVAPLLRAARAAVVPLRLGSGTRLKALEAMAAGRPVVGTTVGLMGLGIRPGDQAIVEDDPVRLADACTRVLQDDALAARLALAGRRHVEAGYLWDDVGRTFVDAVLAGGRRQ